MERGVMNCRNNCDRYCVPFAQICSFSSFERLEGLCVCVCVCVMVVWRDTADVLSSCHALTSVTHLHQALTRDFGRACLI